jgi:hypothetical protein
MTEAAIKQADLPSTVTPLLRPVEERAQVAPAVRLRRTLQRECAHMLHYALAEGKHIPVETAQALAHALSAPVGQADAEIAQLADLTMLHGELSALIAPARGRTLVLLDDERTAHPQLRIFGPVRLVRQMLAFAVLSLAITCLLSTLKTVDVANVANGWFGLHGWDAYCVLGFLMSVAGLGAAFSNLSTINRYIEHANYNPTFEGSYWVRVVLGLISGVVLAEILFDLVLKGGVHSSGELAPAGERVVLAFLGGFATAPVQRLLTNLSDAVGTLLQGRNAPATPSHRPAPAPSAASVQSRDAQRPSGQGARSED